MNYSRGFRIRQMAERKLAERKLNFQGEGLSGVLTWLLTAVGRTEVILVEIKSAGWKLAIAAELKRRSTVTNRALAGTMQPHPQKRLLPVTGRNTDSSSS